MGEWLKHRWRERLRERGNMYHQVSMKRQQCGRKEWMKCMISCKECASSLSTSKWAIITFLIFCQCHLHFFDPCNMLLLHLVANYDLIDWLFKNSRPHAVRYFNAGHSAPLRRSRRDGWVLRDQACGDLWHRPSKLKSKLFQGGWVYLVHSLRKKLFLLILFGTIDKN